MLPVYGDENGKKCLVKKVFTYYGGKAHVFKNGKSR